MKDSSGKAPDAWNWLKQAQNTQVTIFGNTYEAWKGTDEGMVIYLVLREDKKGPLYIYVPGDFPAVLQFLDWSTDTPSRTYFGVPPQCNTT